MVPTSYTVAFEWHDLLLRLKGDVVHLPAPKTHFAKDISLTSDTRIFCTGKHSSCTSKMELWMNVNAV